MDQTQSGDFEVRNVTRDVAVRLATELRNCCSPNEDDLEDEYVPYGQRPETYIVPILFALIFVVGVLGNGTLVLIFVRNRNMRNIPNTYIFSLALGDLLVILTCVPFTSTVYTVESWPYGELICKLSECVKDVSIGVSVFTLTALSAERYCAIVNPMRRHAGHLSTGPLTLISAIGIWVLALLFAMPAAVFSFIKPYDVAGNHSIEVCTPYPSEVYARSMVMIKFLAYFAIPLSIIAFFYILMARHLEASARNLPGEAVMQAAQPQSNQVRARKKVAKMVLAFVVIFIICFLPYQIFTLWFHFYPSSRDVYDEYWHAFRIFGFCLSFINSCVNPITLYCVSRAFRKHYNRYLFCCCLPSGQRRNMDGKYRHPSTYDSSHTLVHFNSTFRRHDVTTSTAFHLDKT
ncbi:neuropeptide CCHamide-2 receptor-like [Ischnura elegans]|uniref:neuropeptide CCHamide-2 receptor-like n=1 Tax=Ischnura elegans TaxID=197161 RepID=UPI001ED8B823|nr:neuropeptide CCHamide-2 receptor-like [Ischnura elegans]